MTQYAKRLDKSRDFGTYHPADQGAHYNQDGLDFDHEGYIVESRLTPEQKAKLAKKPASAPHKQHAPKPPKPAKEPGEGEGGGEAPTKDGLNLEAWLRGEEDYNFDHVRHAVKDRYSVWKTGKRDLILFLVDEQKLVEAERLSDEYKTLIA